METALSRRRFLTSTGALIVAFSLPVELRAQAAAPARPVSDLALDQVDSWLAIGGDGRVTLFSGKVELGTGVETALSQIVAEELDVPPERVTVVQGDTGRTPNQGYTVGSKTLQIGGPQIRQAAAEARQTLLGLAATRLGAPVDHLTVADGLVGVAGDPAKKVSYAELVGGRRFNRTIGKAAAPKSPAHYRVVGQSVRRVELPAKVVGTHVYVHNVRLAGMLHGRVVRPSVAGATLVSIDEASVQGVPGLVKVVREGDFVGVVAEREEQAIAAARELKIRWRPPTTLPEMKELYASMRQAPTTDKVVASGGDVEAALTAAANTLRATYEAPFQTHGSIGPSCAIADVRDGRATVWSGTQGPYPLRNTLAQLLRLSPDNVRVVWVEASGCYGHNGADDVAADAALLSRAVGKPVRVQWMRHDEHGWDPKGPAMVVEVRAGLDAQGRVSAWDYGVWTPTHSTRPDGQAANLLAGQLGGAPPARNGFIGGDRNARPTYVFLNQRVVAHWLATSPLRPSALRGLGGPQNSFATESFIDELAAAAGADPLEFRLRHLADSRAIAVLERVGQLAGWQSRPSPKRDGGGGGPAIGRGLAFAQYESAYAYVATVVHVDVDRKSGEVRVPRVFVAHDCGVVVNPDGVRNQIEGATIQTISRVLKEEVTFDRTGVTSLDWSSYPILTFPEVPEAIEIALIGRPEQPALGAGEPAVCTVPAAIANAIFDATGARLRRLPFTPERVKTALR
jgi:nicotinate dehydrogenase subunit B